MSSNPPEGEHVNVEVPPNVDLPPREPSEDEKRERQTRRRRNQVEIFIATMLGIAAVFAAYSGYKAALADGDAIKGYNEGVIASNDSNQQYIEGNQVLVQDQALFLEYAKSNFAENSDQSEYLKGSLMREELIAAIDAWEAAPDDSGPISPFETDVYEVAQYASAEAFDKQSKAAFKKASQVDEDGDKYTLVTVILAVALFMLGIAGVVKRLGIQVAMGVGGTLITAVGCAYLFTI